MAALAQDRRASMGEMLENWRDARCKIAVTMTLLTERQRHPALFSDGDYEPLAVSGPKTDHICAFARNHGDRALIVAATRFPARLMAGPDWRETEIAIPRTPNVNARWRDLLTGEVLENRLRAASVLSGMPVAVLVPDDDRA